MTDQDVISRAGTARFMLDLGVGARTGGEVAVLLVGDEPLGTVCASVAAILGIGYRLEDEIGDNPAIFQIAEPQTGDEGFRFLFDMAQKLPAGSVVVARSLAPTIMAARLNHATVSVAIAP